MSRSYIGQITSEKQVGTENRNLPNRDTQKNFQNYEITRKESISKVETKKVREINILIDL